ncbi:cystathionine gamma-synthase family protein [Marinilabilia rubra]|uniref:Cystathionine gamma-synthase family protein n=1 Tax=Marinilabilia rubra TaxID=2162893 RepID=A0A2U2B7W4_9BACT|nr:cystathionine gamma-synthase family protein [Marinilabilia rubra]PWD99159.1 cystathionine gamma-synthase family protein [Marinilabilia rubra]
MKKNQYSPESLMMSYGYKASDHQGAVKCPLFQTSTFAFHSASEGKAFFELAYGLREPEAGEEMGMIYSRVNNPNLELAEKRLALWDKADGAAFFASGMAAISTMMFTFLRPNDILLFGSPVYGGTDHFIHHVLPDFGIRTLMFTSLDSEKEILQRLEDTFPGEQPSLIYIETPGNPTNNLIDIEMCARLRNEFVSGRKDCLLAVDNTFLGPVFQRPLEHGADLVVYSATKFISGHSDVIAGACAGRNETIGRLKAMRTFLGSMLDPHSCWLVMRSLETLQIRMERQDASARKVAEYVAQHPKVESVHFLGYLRDDDPQKQIFKKQCLSSGSMISFNIKGGEKEAFRFLDNLTLFKLAVSLGSTESLAEHPATMTHVDVSEEDRQKLGILPNLVRLSIGLEDPEDLIQAVESAFGKV